MSRPRILIVDDDPQIVTLLGEHLTQAGYDVATAHNAWEALAALQQQETSVVITDLRMPGADGIDLLRQVRQISPETEVIILTAYGSLETAVLAMREGGAFDYLLKPLPELGQLDLTIARALEVRRLRKEAVLYQKREEMYQAGRELAAALLTPFHTVELHLAELSEMLPEGSPALALLHKVEARTQELRMIIEQIHEKLRESVA